MTKLFSSEMRRDPFATYEVLRRCSPVLHDAGADLWMIFDYDGARRALTDHEAFSSSVSPPTTRTGRWLIFSDPPRHTQLRALIGRAFTPRAVAGLEPRVRALAHRLLDRHAERGEMDLVGDFSVPLPLMVIAGLLGAPVADWPLYRRWSDAIMALAFTVSGGAAGERGASVFAEVSDEMEEYLHRLIDERRARPRDDLLTRLLAAEVDGARLGLDDILGFFQLLLVAGHETTTNLIDNAVLCLLEHPGALARLRADARLWPAAIEEVLRFRGPVQATFRVTRAPVTLAGHAIPAGKLVLVVVGSANRDAQHFRDPDRFDIARDPNPHLAFGHGIHFCVGAPLARLEARVALPALYERLADLRRATDGPWEPRAAFHVLGPSRLPIRFTANRRERPDRVA